MSDGCGARAAQTLGHAQMSLDLIRACFAAQLLRRFYDLIDSTGPDGVPAGFQSSHSANGRLAVEVESTFFGQVRCLASFGKTAGFQR